MASLENRHFDLLVIGGGIYGAWTTLDAAMRGLDVAIVEQNDWASGTSSASSKLIHGGLRYLEHFRLGQVKKSLAERRLLSTLAPHQVRPLRFVAPLYRSGRLAPWRVRVGLKFYDRLAGADSPVESSVSMSKKDIAAHYPFLRTEDLRAGFAYGDCVTDDARFVIEIIDAATRASAVAVNYAEAANLMRANGRVCGAVVRDVMTDATVEVTATTVVNAAGAWAQNLSGNIEDARPVRVTKGIHLVLPELPTTDAFLLTTQRDGRVFFAVPWYGRTLLGTTDTDYDGPPNAVRVEAEDVDYLIEEANHFVPGAKWDTSSILGSFAGLRVLRDITKKHPSAVSREWTFIEPCHGLIVSIGGKYTSARADAACMVDSVMKAQGKKSGPRSPTTDARLPWTPAGKFALWQRIATDRCVSAGLDANTARWSTLRYGTRVDRLCELLGTRPDLASRIVSDLPFARAEIVLAARDEMAITLEDILRRRIPLLVLSPLDHAAIKDAAALAAPVRGWSLKRCEEEIRRVMKQTAAVV